jgi:hypothetical protein
LSWSVILRSAWLSMSAVAGPASAGMADPLDLS